MSVKRSCIFKQNLNITFTYKEPLKHPRQSKNMISQSMIFPGSLTQRSPLSQVAPVKNMNIKLKPNRQMFQSMYYENSLSQMNRSHIDDHSISIQQQKSTKLTKLLFLQTQVIHEEIFETQIQDFQIGQLLGKGATGNVYVCRHKQTGFFFALKTIKKKNVRDINQIVQSIKIHMFLNQPNIVKLYSVFSDTQKIYLLMELCCDGDLKTQSKYIRKTKQVKNYMLGIAYGLRHLHKRNIRHGDIKLENIMCSYGMPKIADFDCIRPAKQNTIEHRSKSRLWGSPMYFSPEMIGQSIFRLNDDVWSLGIMSFELLCGYFPFEVADHNDLRNIVSEQIKKFPQQTQIFLQELIRQMLSKRLCERPNLSTIIKQLQKK